MLPSPPTAGFCAQYRTTPKLRVLRNRPAGPKFIQMKILATMTDLLSSSKICCMCVL
ncbi:hypothetical protein Hdeb2414_s0024g00654801 [Helianthus debilis subsp. tardiflorus]